MGYLITDKYRDFFNSKGLKKSIFIILNFFGFLNDIRKYRKFAELKSYITWELKLIFNIWNDFLVIRTIDSQLINTELLQFFPFNINLPEDVTKSKFELTKSETDWEKIFAISECEVIGNTVHERHILYGGEINGSIRKKLHVFNKPIESIYVNSEKTVFICSAGILFRSKNGGRHFSKVLEMSGRESKFMYHVGMTEIDSKTLLVGEYSNIWNRVKGWVNASNLYFSYDEGLSWKKTNFLKDFGVNKHIHIIKYLKNLGLLVLTDGDNKKQIWTCKVNKKLQSENDFANVNRWKLLTKKHIDFGGYSAIIELENKTILGTDYFGGTNFLVETSDFKNFRKRIIPNPYRRGLVECLVKTNDILWASIKPPKFNGSKGLLMYSTDNAETWYKFFEYDNRKFNLEIISKGTSESYPDFMFFSLKNTEKENEYYVFKIKKAD